MNICVVIESIAGMPENSYAFIGDEKSGCTGQKAEEKFKELARLVCPGINEEDLSEALDDGVFEYGYNISICLTWPLVIHA